MSLKSQEPERGEAPWDWKAQEVNSERVDLTLTMAAIFEH
jgi:hypothetical protein